MLTQYLAKLKGKLGFISRQADGSSVEQPLSEALAPKHMERPTESQAESQSLTIRQEVICNLLTGEGLEIGALHNPLSVPAHVRVRYIDRMSLDELRKHYPELSQVDLVEPDIIDDGQILATIEDASVDFVIANHMIEHSQDPITALRNWLRVIKPGGVVYLTVPDKRSTFDNGRKITTIKHVMRDYADGGRNSRDAHFKEWVKLVYKVPRKEVKEVMRRLMDMDYSIHYHVWTTKDFMGLLEHCRTRLSFPFNIEIFQEDETELFAVLRKEQPR